MSHELPKPEDFNRETRRGRFGMTNKHIRPLLQFGPSERAIKRVTAGRTR